MDDLNGRVAVVTGGGSGIGRGLALGLGAEGMTVAVADLRASSAEVVAAEIESAGGRAFAVGVDVTSAESLATAAKEVIARAGGVNLLCANAGVLARLGALEAHASSESCWSLSTESAAVPSFSCAWDRALLSPLHIARRSIPNGRRPASPSEAHSSIATCRVGNHLRAAR